MSCNEMAAGTAGAARVRYDVGSADRRLRPRWRASARTSVGGGDESKWSIEWEKSGLSGGRKEAAGKR